MKNRSSFFLANFIILLSFYSYGFSASIDSVYKYAWGENIGWLDFSNVVVEDNKLSGYIWSENIGWISVDKVKNDGEGNLSGYAFSENAGWINFDGVKIKSSGEFTGYAWGENIGWISLSCGNTKSCSSSDYKVITNWKPISLRPECNNSLDDDKDGKIDYPSDAGCSSLDDNSEYEPKAGYIINNINSIDIGNNFKSQIKKDNNRKTETETQPQYLLGQQKTFNPKPNNKKENNSFVNRQNYNPNKKTVKDNNYSTGQEFLIGFNSGNIPNNINKGHKRNRSVYNNNEANTKGYDNIASRKFTANIFSLIDSIRGHSAGNNENNNVILPTFSQIKTKYPDDYIDRLPPLLPFIESVDEKIDISTSLEKKEDGYIHKIRLIEGKEFKVIVKSSKNSDRAVGVLAKQKNDSGFFRLNVFADNEIINFDYRKISNNVYSADIVIPYEAGNYKIITSFYNEDNELVEKSESDVIVEKRGNVYKDNTDSGNIILGAKVYLYKLDGTRGNYYLWNASDYAQENPYVIGSSGYYFIVPNGIYFVKAVSPLGDEVKTEPFLVNDNIINRDIVFSNYNFLYSADFIIVLIIVVTFVILTLSMVYFRRR